MRIIKLLSGSQLVLHSHRELFVRVSNNLYFNNTRWIVSNITTMPAKCGSKTLNSPKNKIACCSLNINKFYSSNSSVSPSRLPTDFDNTNHVPDTNVNLIDNIELLNHLERTSLVDFGSEEAVARLEEAIKFAEVLFEVNTAGVKPMDSVLENESLNLREDTIIETCRDDILLNASVTEEDYFVAPPGNIPLDSSAANRLLKESMGKKSTE